MELENSWESSYYSDSSDTLSTSSILSENEKSSIPVMEIEDKTLHRRKPKILNSSSSEENDSSVSSATLSENEESSIPVMENEDKSLHRTKAKVLNSSSSEENDSNVSSATLSENEESSIPVMENEDKSLHRRKTKVLNSSSSEENDSNVSSATLSKNEGSSILSMKKKDKTLPVRKAKVLNSSSSEEEYSHMSPLVLKKNKESSTPVMENEDKTLHRRKAKELNSSSSEEKDSYVSSDDSFGSSSKQSISDKNGEAHPSTTASVDYDTENYNSVSRNSESMPTMICESITEEHIQKNNSKQKDANRQEQHSSTGSAKNVCDPNTEEEVQKNDSKEDYSSTRSKAIIDSDTDSGSEKEVDIIDVSTDEEPISRTVKKQIILPQVLKQLNNTNSNVQRKEIVKEKPVENVVLKQNYTANSIVSQAEYDEQMATVRNLRDDYRKMQGLLNTINLSTLPDKGQLLHKKHENLRDAVKFAETKLSTMQVNKDLKTEPTKYLKVVPWEELQAMSEAVQPKTFGQTAIATINAQKAVTMEHLQQIHKSLETRPTEDTVAESPRGLKVELMPHQKHALAWILWREGQKPSGGILADDMGLGKTLTMISLVLKTREIKESLGDERDSDEENLNQRSSKYPGGTLVVCPASLVRQWEAEVDKHCKRYLLSVELYHGPKRETRPRTLAKRDMVITTYTICMHEYEKKSPLYQVRWRRIILDEAHIVRNYKSQTSVAVCALSAQSRWALTGTPVHNKEEDMFALMKFLRCAPLDDISLWKRWVGNKRTGGQDRLNTILSSTMLRRTKASLQEKGALQSLPTREFEAINLSLQGQERAVYEKILIFSRTLFAQYLHQHAEKEQDYMALGQYRSLSKDPNTVYYQMHQRMVKLNKVKEVRSHEILVLLLRLRQMCCHPSLIVKMLQSDQLESDIEGGEDIDLLEEMRKLSINDKVDDGLPSASQQDDDNNADEKSLNELLDPNNPLFSEERKSTKMEAVLKLLKERILPTTEKAIVVSQWTSLLRLLGNYLKESNIPFGQLDGSVVVVKRMPIIDNFNNPNHPMKVLLLSLTAGGVGLNLTGGNHMLLLDLHWNPQLEMQAQDRIYRVGQQRSVHIYKFMTLNTIEERIKNLQDLKLSMANSILTGSKGHNMKLTLQDLRMIFSM